MEVTFFNPTIPSLVGSTLFAQSISDTSRKILDLVENIFHYDCSIKEVLTETDIQATLKTLDEFVKEINEHNNKTLHIALENLNIIIEEIHTILNQIIYFYKFYVYKNIYFYIFLFFYINGKKKQKKNKVGL
jgi:hypothetical protein